MTPAEVRAADRCRTACSPSRAGAPRVLWLTNIPLPQVTSRAGMVPGVGGGWMSAGLSALLDHGRVRLTCASRSWPAPPPFEADGVRYVTLEGGEPFGRWRGLVSAWRSGGRQEPPTAEIEALLEQERPDVVHVHGSETPNALAALEASGRMGIPVLVSIQGPVSEYAPLFFTGFDRAEIARDILSTEFLKGRGLVHAWRRMRNAAALERVALGLVQEVAGRTAWDRAIVERSNPGARYWQVDEVLRPEFSEVSWEGRDGAAPVIVSVSSGAPYKGIDVLLRAFAAVRAAWPVARLRVIGPIAGTPVWPALQRLERRLDLAGAVDWAGPLPADAVAGALRSCSVYACASRIENSPNSVCEAMLVGAPVVAPATGGVPSLVHDGTDGLLFPRGDATSLASAIDSLLGDAALSQRLGAAARTAARGRHDPERVAHQLQTAYETLAGTRP